MPAHNVNTAALAQVVEAARRYDELTELLGLAPVDEEDFPLSGSVRDIERVLEVANSNGDIIILENGRRH